MSNGSRKTVPEQEAAAGMSSSSRKTAVDTRKSGSANRGARREKAETNSVDILDGKERLNAERDRAAAIKKIKQKVANKMSAADRAIADGPVDEDAVTEEAAQAEELSTEEEQREKAKIDESDSFNQAENDTGLKDAASRPTASGMVEVQDFASTSSETATPVSRRPSYQFCRICHECGTEDLFISPCKCRGSLSLVHRWCLERWLAESDTNHCELCGFSYVVYRKPKFNVIWSLILWIWSKAPHSERKMMFYDLTLFFIFGPLIVLLTFYSFQVADTILVQDVMDKLMYLIDKAKIQKRRDDFHFLASWVARTLQLSVISLIITFDVGFLSWTIVRLGYHIKKWYRWYRRNCVVVLGGYHNTQAVMPSHTDSVANVRRIAF